MLFMRYTLVLLAVACVSYDLLALAAAVPITSGQLRLHSTDDLRGTRSLMRKEEKRLFKCRPQVLLLTFCTASLSMHPGVTERSRSLLPYHHSLWNCSVDKQQNCIQCLRRPPEWPDPPLSIRCADTFTEDGARPKNNLLAAYAVAIQGLTKRFPSTVTLNRDNAA